MKVKNIMFSGVMAAILSGVACSADAAGFQVASKQYVDARENAIVAAQGAVDAGQNTEIAKKADKATTLAGYGITDAYTKAEVDETFETIANVNIKVKELADTVGGTGPDGSTGIVSTVTQQGNRITDLESKVGDKTVANQISEALQTYTTENDINGLSGRVDAAETDIDNLQTALTEAGTTGAAIKANADAIIEMKNAETGILKQANNYTDALANGAVATNTAAITTLDGDVTVEGSVKKQIKDASDATKTAYEAYALPKPSAECANTTCVLATDKNGQPYWTQLWMYGADGESATETNP